MKWILGVQYNGVGYSGWQRQKNICSIQECLECAISRVADEEVRVFCASRTDSGVHAIGQVVHFYTNVFRSQYSWVSGINRNLPVDIVVQWVVESMDVNFHSRFSAIARRYRYIICNSNIRSPFLNDKVTYYKRCLDVEKMKNASRCLLGEQDFTSFRAAKCQSLSAYRNLHHLLIFRRGCYVIFDIQANSFVYRMVRNIVGSLVEVGLGIRPESWISELLLKKNRSLGGITVSSSGLYLVQVQYPAYYCFPELDFDCNLLFF